MGLAEADSPPKPRSHAITEGLIPPTTYKYQVLDRTKVLHGPRTQTYGETNYLRNQVLDRTKVLHGPQTQTYRETNYLRNQVLDRTNVLHGPRTQTYGETNYLRIKFWTESRYCMVLGLKPMGKPTT